MVKTLKKIVLIQDYRNSFYSKIDNQKTLCSMDVGKIVNNFRELGFFVEVKNFENIDFLASWVGIPVIYTSSEDIGSIYKSYIEDVMLALEQLGAVLLPSYLYLRGHHNKTFMEALRYKLFPEESKKLNSRCFGTYEELVKADLGGKWPKVIKAAFGAGSKQVEKASDQKELLKIARKFCGFMPINDVLREYRSRILWRGYVNKSLRRSKFVVQNLVLGLDGDFKVLKYGERYYLLTRRNRTGDFRASGSGDFSFNIPQNVEQEALLDYAKAISERIGTPLCSLDIGFDGTAFHLIEYQCLNFGPLTAERSLHYHKNIGGRWTTVVEKCDLEYIFCEAIADYIMHDKELIST